MLMCICSINYFRKYVYVIRQVAAVMAIIMGASTASWSYKYPRKNGASSGALLSLAWQDGTYIGKFVENKASYQIYMMDI